MNYQLASSIIKGKWAIDPLFAMNSLSMVNDLLSGKIVVEQTQDAKLPLAVSLNAETGSFDSHDLNEAPVNSLGVIKISGTLFKADQECGPHGMATIGEAIKQADQNPNLDGILLVIDSPGGTVDGTAALAEIVKATSKPIIAFADGLMASAALWIGASADEIIASNDYCEIGSVGVLLSFSDFQPAYEKQGVKFHTITAPQSSEKVKMWEDVRAGNYDELKNDVLKPLAEEFINVMKSNRPLSEEKHLKGKVFFAKDVVGAFVDGIGNMDFALNRLSQLCSENKPNSNSNKNNLTMKHEAINTLLGAELQSTNDGVFLNEQQLDKINAAVLQGIADASALTAANTAASDAGKAQQKSAEDLVTANSTIATQVAEIEELKTKPGAETATVVTTIDKVVTDDKDGNVVKDNNEFADNMQAVAEEFLS